MFNSVEFKVVSEDICIDASRDRSNILSPNSLRKLLAHSNISLALYKRKDQFLKLDKLLQQYIYTLCRHCF